MKQDIDYDDGQSLKSKHLEKLKKMKLESEYLQEDEMLCNSINVKI